MGRRKKSCRVIEIKKRPLDLYQITLEDKSIFLIEADEAWHDENVLELRDNDKVVAAFKKWTSYQLLQKVKKAELKEESL